MKNEKLKRKHLVTIRLNDIDFKNTIAFSNRMNLSLSCFFRLRAFSSLKHFYVFDGICHSISNVIIGALFMKNENFKRKNIITIRLNDLEYKDVVEYCKRLNISISDYFRYISLSFLVGGDQCENK